MDKASVIHPVSTFNGRSTTDTEDGVSTSFYQRIVRNGLPASVIDLFPIEVGRVIMIAPDEHNPDIVFLQPMTASVNDVFIISLFPKAKPAVTGNDNQRIGHVVFHNDFIDEMVKIAVYIA